MKPLRITLQTKLSPTEVQLVNLTNAAANEDVVLPGTVTKASCDYDR